jgi:hypothetical protein
VRAHGGPEEVAHVIDELVVEPAAAAFLEVGTFVALALAGFGLLRWYLGDGLTRWLQAGAHRGPLAGAVLGAVPGCGGAIVVLPLYLRREVSFGTVVATMTATMGDSSFVLLAADPRLAVTVHGGLVVVGAVTGALVDRVGITPRPRPDPEVAVAEAARAVAPAAAVAGPAAPPVGLTGRPQGRAGSGGTEVRPRPWGAIGFWALLLAGFVVAVPTVLQLVPPSRFDLAGLPTVTVIGVLGAAASILITAATRRGTHLDHAARPVAVRPREVLVETATETARIATWVIVAFVGYELLIAGTGWDLAALPSAGVLAVLAGALLGLIPGCGPQLVLTGLWVQGAIPLSVLAANALSQDGDALIPLLAADRRAAVLASVITVVPGLAVGWGLLALGL